MKSKKKQQFVNITYEILEREGVAGVSIRRIASEMGCTSTVIYNYFENVEHLITVASVRYLDAYIEDYKNITKMGLDPVEFNLKLWESFTGCALNHMDIFEMMFFGKYKECLIEIIFEYYEMFPDSYREMDGLVVSLMFNGNLQERDYIMYRRAANLGYLDFDMAKMLAETEVYMFHGVLMEYKNKALTKEEIEEIRLRYNRTIRTIVEKFKKTGGNR